eukprot:UN03136
MTILVAAHRLCRSSYFAPSRDKSTARFNSWALSLLPSQSASANTRNNIPINRHQRLIQSVDTLHTNPRILWVRPCNKVIQLNIRILHSIIKTPTPKQIWEISLMMTHHIISRITTIVPAPLRIAKIEDQIIALTIRGRRDTSGSEIGIGIAAEHAIARQNANVND